MQWQWKEEKEGEKIGVSTQLHFGVMSWTVFTLPYSTLVYSIQLQETLCGQVCLSLLLAKAVTATAAAEGERETGEKEGLKA